MLCSSAVLQTGGAGGNFKGPLRSAAFRGFLEAIDLGRFRLVYLWRSAEYLEPSMGEAQRSISGKRAKVMDGRSSRSRMRVVGRESLAGWMVRRPESCRNTVKWALQKAHGKFLGARSWGKDARSAGLTDFWGLKRCRLVASFVIVPLFSFRRSTWSSEGRAGTGNQKVTEGGPRGW